MTVLRPHDGVALATEIFDAIAAAEDDLGLLRQIGAVAA